MFSKPKSIDDWGGIKPYLNGTREEHNGLGYMAFKRRINPNRKHPVPKPVIAEDFGVSKQTIYDWIKREKAATSEQPSESSN